MKSIFRKECGYWKIFHRLIVQDIHTLVPWEGLIFTIFGILLDEEFDLENRFLF